MKKFSFLLIPILVFSACNEKVKSSIEAESKKPNIILIMSDDQAWGDLSFYGNSDIETPNIDALAKNGASFDNFYVQPVCSPTRAELLTGRHFTRLGVHRTSAGGERMNLNETTIAEILKQAGYQTAAYGKWHNGMQPPYHPNSRGFDDYYGFTSGHWGNYFSPILEHNGKIVKGNGFLVDDLIDHGIDFIEKNQEQPFFLYLPLNTPHSPMQVPDEYWNRFKDKNLEMQYQGDQSTTLTHTKAALAMVENIDHNVGRVTKRLKELNLEKNTIVMYLSDNGPNGWRWNGGMRGRKGSTDEGGVRSPLFIQWKDKIKANTKIGQITSAIDLLPTLADLTEVKAETKKPVDGRSFKALLFGENDEWKSKLVFNHWNGKTSVRSQHYRLDNENKLYHITKERSQRTDVSMKNPKMLDSLKNAKSKWLSEIEPMNSETDDRPFSLGHPDFEFTQIPARDGIPHGNIERSNRYPNNTFFTNWKSVKDSVSWDVEVLADGEFEVKLYYTMKPASTADGPEDAGVAVQLSHGTSKLITRITESHDPPLTGMENDRDPRIESYVKDFKPKILVKIEKKKKHASHKIQTIAQMDTHHTLKLKK